MKRVLERPASYSMPTSPAPHSPAALPKRLRGESRAGSTAAGPAERLANSRPRANSDRSSI